ncbi:MAG: acetyl-CoA carboxylase carboxyltransferase subunit beta [Enterobacteriaceae bacterium]|nr:acetyl-CoA carboxylase carboxyltransferase subunit beta [Enterobacteriaceae bacterium]
MNWYNEVKLLKVNVLSKAYSFPRSWIKCNACNSILFFKKLKFNFNVCYKCNYHFKIFSRIRAMKFFDFGAFEELGGNFLPVDFFYFFDTKSYVFRIIDAQIKTRETEALCIFKGKIELLDVIVCLFEFEFIGGSMGQVIGDKLVYAINICIKYRVPLICFCTSGGARMQESIVSLMQMPKISAALGILSKFRLPFISVIINPCMGGVSASLAMLGDINISEPGALVGFAGPRVVIGIVRNRVPDNFQSSESVLCNGFIDFICSRVELKSRIVTLLKTLLRI